MDRDDQADDLASVTFQALTDSESKEAENAGRIEPAPSQMKELLTSVLSAAVKAAPETGRALMQRGQYVVEFSAEGRAALQKGTAKLLQRTTGRFQPTLIGKGAKFRENAVLVGRLGGGVATAVAVSHLVIVLAVQAQLASMEKTLERIEKKVDAIQQWLDHSMVAKVKGRLKTLHKLRDRMLAAEWTSEERQEWRTALHAADVEFTQVDEFARAQRERTMTQLRATKPAVTFGGPTATTIAAELKGHMEKHRANEDLLLLALLGRVVVARLRAGLGIEEGTDVLREDLDRTLSSARAHMVLMEEKVDGFSTWFRRSKYEADTRSTLRGHAREALDRCEHVTRRLGAQIDAMYADRSSSVMALLEVSDGQVSNVRLIEPS